MSTSRNLQLARDLVAYFMEQRSWLMTEDNAGIVSLLDGGNECEIDFLPGESVEAIRGNLMKAIQLAGEPAPMPTIGRNRASRKAATDLERKEIILFARAALALIEGERPARETGDAGALAVLRGVQAMAAAYLAGGRA